MIMNDITSTVKAMIDIALVWILAYSVIKNLKDNVKMVFLLKGVIILIIVKLFL